MPQEEADSLCDSFAERSSAVNLPEQTNNVLTGMAPERVRVITEATYEAVATDQEFTLSELEDVLHRLKDTAPGDDTVCNSMIKNVPLATKHHFLRVINQSFSEGKLPTRWKMAKIIPIPKKDKTHRPISLLPVISKVMERLVLARVKWSAQPINPYSLFNMVINRLLQLDLGSKVQMTAYADDLAIHGGPIGEDTVYKQMTTALKKIEAEAMQLGLKFSPEKCEALWYRSVDPDWNFKIAGARIPWRASVK